MKRGGVFALITYILYTLLFGGLYIALLKWLESIEDEKLYPVVLVILMAIVGACLALAICGLVATVLKLLHMATGWLVFGIFCILIDAFVLVYIVSSVFPATYSDIITQGVTETSIIVIIGIIVSFFLSVGALVSNIRSLKS